MIVLEPETRKQVGFHLNGKHVETWVGPNETLLAVLRDKLGAMEVKYGCGEGVCGTCTVLVDDVPVSSCLILGLQVQGREVTTVKGLEKNGGLHPLQAAFVQHEAVQCGFCTPGMLLTAYALLKENPRPSRDEVRAALAGNLCRCTGYTRIIDAVMTVAKGGIENAR